MGKIRRFVRSITQKLHPNQRVRSADVITQNCSWHIDFSMVYDRAAPKNYLLLSEAAIFLKTDYNQIHKVWGRAHQAGSPVKFVRNHVVFEHLRRLTPGSTLDVGCGTGEYSLFMSQMGHRVTAFDPSTYAIDRLLTTEAGNFAIKAQVNTIDNFQPNEAFDNIISIEVFEHLNDDLKAMKRLYSWLKPGGTVVLSVPATPWLYSEGDRVSGHYRRYSFKSLLSLIRDASFRDAKIYKYGFPLLFTYLLMNRFFFSKFLIRRFSSDSGRSATNSTNRLSRLFPVLLRMDWLNLPIWSVGYVATFKK